MTISPSIYKKKRSLMLIISILFLFDYLAFCYHTDRNPFDIFPSFPILYDKRTINVFLPNIDGKTILKETRKISYIDDIEGFIRLLFKIVVKGSNFENTSIVIPIDPFIRKIWIYNEICIVDVENSLINENIFVIPHSEDLFKKALEKTILENIQYLQRVIIFERGIPEKKLWAVL